MLLTIDCSLWKNSTTPEIDLATQPIVATDLSVVKGMPVASRQIGHIAHEQRDLAHALTQLRVYNQTRGNAGGAGTSMGHWTSAVAYQSGSVCGHLWSCHREQATWRCR